MRHGATFALVPILWLGGALAPAEAGPWSLPDDSQGTRVAPLLLLSRPDVREDLAITADQSAEIDRAIAEIHRKAESLRGRNDDEIKAGRRIIDEQQRTWLETRLTVEQRERLAQLDLRWEGPAAITTRKIVADSLALTDEQHAALHRAAVECNARREKGQTPSSSEHQHSQKAMAVLSEAQMLRWERMLGRPFAVRATAATHHQAAR